MDPELLVMTDYGKTARHQTLHLAFQGLHMFIQKERRLPKPTSQVSGGRSKRLFVTSGKEEGFYFCAISLKMN